MWATHSGAVGGGPDDGGRLSEAGGLEREVLGPAGELGSKDGGRVDGERVGLGRSDTLPQSVDEQRGRIDVGEELRS